MLFKNPCKNKNKPYLIFFLDKLANIEYDWLIKNME